MADSQNQGAAAKQSNDQTMRQPGHPKQQKGFISSNHEKAKEQAEKLLNAISNDKLQSRGVKQANFMILKKSNCPAITLELGYLSNENDRNYITSEEGQNEIAENIVKSLQ